MVEAAGDQVVDLIRLRIEHIELGNLQAGVHRNLTGLEAKDLLTKLGLK